VITVSSFDDASTALLVILLLLLLLLLVVCPAGSNGPMYVPGSSTGPFNANQASAKPNAQQQFYTGGTSGEPTAVNSAHIVTVLRYLWQQ
jgi:predicted small lipoprotein YifL